MLNWSILLNYTLKIMFAQNPKHCELPIIYRHDYQQFLADKIITVYYYCEGPKLNNDNIRKNIS